MVHYCSAVRARTLILLLDPTSDDACSVFIRLIGEPMFCATQTHERLLSPPFCHPSAVAVALRFSLSFSRLNSLAHEFSLHVN